MVTSSSSPDHVAADIWRVYGIGRNDGAQWSADGRTLVVFSHDLIAALLRSDDMCASHPFRSTRHAMGRTLIDTDGAEHGRLRRVIGPLFRRGLVESMKGGSIEPIAARLADAVTAGDLTVLEFADRLPLLVLAHALGIEADDPTWWSVRLHQLFELIAGDGDLTSAIAAREELDIAIKKALAASAMDAAWRRWTDEFSEEEIVRTVISLMVAGTTTTSIALRLLVGALLDRPEQTAEVRGSAEKRRAFINRSLMADPPVHSTVRFAQSVCDVAGEAVPQGTPIKLLLASGNRDPAVRRRDVGLTFGLGRHSCIGEHLAMAELDIALEQLLHRVDISGRASVGHRGMDVVFADHEIAVSVTPRTASTRPGHSARAAQRNA